MALTRPHKIRAALQLQMYILTGIHRLQVVTSRGLPRLCESTTKIKVTLLSKQQLQRSKAYFSVTNNTYN